MRKLILLLIILLHLAACQPIAPALPPTQPYAEVQTAAARTVEAYLQASPTRPEPSSTPSPTASPGQSDATVTPIVMATASAADSFWVTYISLGGLWISRSDGSMPTRLTNTPAQDFLPDWSPDGKTLAFLRFYDPDSFNGNLMVLPADSNTPSLLTPERQYTSFTWLPNSLSLLAVSGDMRLPKSFLINAVTGDELALEELDGGMPVLSPDGTKIAALVAESLCQGENCLSPNDLFVYELATGKVTQVTDDSTAKEWLAWSPDSKLLAYHVRDTDSATREVATLDGAPPTSSGDAPWWARLFYAVSPDGKQIAYVTPTTTDGTGTTEVQVIPFGFNTENVRPIARLTKADQGVDPYIDSIHWLPDRSAVVFDSFGTLFVAPVDGSGFKELPIEMEKSTFDLLPAAASAYSPPPEPTAPAAWHVCPGGLRSNLDVGMKASVSSDPPTPNNVRAGPSTKNTRRGQIQPGEVVEILSGPECAEDMIWWEVRSPSTGLTGWTAEGTIGAYWLSPVD